MHLPWRFIPRAVDNTQPHYCTGGLYFSSWETWALWFILSQSLAKPPAALNVPNNPLLKIVPKTCIIDQSSFICLYRSTKLRWESTSPFFRWIESRSLEKSGTMSNGLMLCNKCNLIHSLVYHPLQGTIKGAILPHLTLIISFWSHKFNFTFTVKTMFYVQVKYVE